MATNTLPTRRAAHPEIDYYMALLEAAMAQGITGAPLEELNVLCWYAPQPGVAMRKWGEQYSVNAPCPNCGGRRTLVGVISQADAQGPHVPDEPIACPLCQER